MADWDIKHHTTSRDTYQYTAANTFELARTPFAGGALTANADIVLVMFGRLGGESSANRQETEIRVGGTAIGRNRILEPNKPFVNSGNTVTQIYRYTDAGGANSEVVQLWARNLDATNGLCVPTLQFLAFNVDDIGTDNYLWNEQTTAEQPGPQTYTGKASITIPAGVDDRWLVFYQAEFDCNNTQDEMYVRLHDGTAAITASEIIDEAEDTAEQRHLGGFINIDGDASSQTITLQVQTGAGVSDYIASRIFAFKYTASEDFHVYSNTSTYNIGSLTTNYSPFTVQLTGGTGVSVTGDFMALGTARQTKTTLTAARTASAWWRRKNSDAFSAIIDSAYPNPPTASGGGADAAVASQYGNSINAINDYAWTESLTSGDTFSVRPEYYEYSDITISNDLTFHQIVMFSMQKAAAGAIQAAWTDGATVSDSLATNLAIHSVVSEAATVSDSNIAAAHFLASVDESLTVSDTGAGIAAILRALSDATSISEVLEAFTTLGAAFAESVQVSDALQARVDSLVALVEAASAGDDQTATAAVTSLLSAGTSIADVWSTAAANLAETADNAAAADAWLSISAIFGAIADGAIVDSQFSAAVRAQSSLIDSISATDFYSGAVTGVTEGILSDEAIAGSDFAASARVLAETINSAIAGGSFVGITGNEGQLAESVTVADVTIATAFILSAFADSVALSDVWQIIQRGSGALSGSVITADAWVTVSGNTSTFSDSVSAAGILAAQTVIQSAIAGNVTATADFAATTAGQAALAFSVVVLDQWSQGDELGIVLGAIRLFAALTGMDNVVIYSATDSESIAIRPN